MILTKLDGDTRGGAALSVRAVTGKPIKFVGMGEKLAAGGRFHHAAQVHDGHVIAHEAYHTEIVGNEQVGEPHVFLHVLQKIQNLRLYRSIQSRNGLIAHQRPRPGHHGSRHGDALPLTAGKFMGIPVDMFRLEPHAGKDIPHACATFRTGERMPRSLRRKHERFRNGRAHRLAGVQRRKRILKHHLNAACPFGSRPFPEGTAGKQHLAGRRGQKPHHHARQRGLAAAGLAHKAQRPPGIQRKAHPVHGPDARRTRVEKASAHGKFPAYLHKFQQCIHR